MADNVTYTAAADATPPGGTKAATDELSDGSHAGIAKIAVSADGDRTLIPATAADGLLVQVSNPTAGTGLTDAELRATPVPVSGTVSVTEPVSVDDNGGSLTVDNAVLSVVGGGTEAAAQRVTIANDSTGLLSVDDNGGSLTVDNSVLSVVGGGTEAAAQRVTIANDTTGVLSVDDNGGSLTVDGPLTDAQLRATPVPVSGTITANVPEPLDTQIKILADDTSSIEVGQTGSGGIPMPVSGPDNSSDPVPVDGDVQVEGEIAHDSALSGNPVAIGGRAGQVAPSPVSADGDATWLRTSRFGDLSVKVSDGNGVLVPSEGSADGGIPVEPVGGGAFPIKDNGGSITVDGSVTANAGTNLNTSLLALEAGGNLAAAAASLSVMDDWDETDRAKVNIIAGQVGVAGGTGTDSALTQRVSLATNVPLPAGTNAIGKLSANSGVDIGDVTVDNAAGAAAVNIQDGGNSITVDGTVTADTELPAAAALSDSFANPTAPAVGGFEMYWDPANSVWKRVRMTQQMNAGVDTLAVTPVGFTGTPMLAGYAADASSGGDNINVAPTVFNGTTFDRMRGDITNGVDVDVTRLPAIPAGNNNIGDVDIASFPATALEVVGDVAADIGVPANPVSVGGRASDALPTEVSADGDSVYKWLLRNGATMTAQLPHLGLIGDPYTLDSETAQYTTAQTSTILVSVGTGPQLAVTSIQIQAGGTVAGTVMVYFGDGSYNRGNSLAIFDGEFAPSTTLKPGFAMSPSKPWIGPVNQDLRVTGVGAINPLTITVWFYLIS